MSRGDYRSLSTSFKHELARDAAYGSILRRRRRELHRRVGEAMEVVFAENLEDSAHRLAFHFSRADDDDRALKYYAMAAEAADGLNAATEAASHYAHAL